MISWSRKTKTRQPGHGKSAGKTARKKRALQRGYNRSVDTQHESDRFVTEEGVALVERIQPLLERFAADLSGEQLLGALSQAVSRVRTSAADATTRAMARGLTVRERLKRAEGGSLSAESAARYCGLSKEGLLKRYHSGKTLAWREERQRALRFPHGSSAARIAGCRRA